MNLTVLEASTDLVDEPVLDVDLREQAPARFPTSFSTAAGFDRGSRPTPASTRAACGFRPEDAQFLRVLPGLRRVDQSPTHQSRSFAHFATGVFRPLTIDALIARDRLEEECLLDGSPIALRHQDCRMPFTGNLDGLVRVRDVRQEIVQARLLRLR